MSSEISLIFEKEKKFREFHIWPFSSELDVRQWLSNFDEHHNEFALRLLDGFNYIADPLINAMLAGAMQRMVTHAAGSAFMPGADFFNETIFVLVQGEQPSASDSGYMYARKLRDKLAVEEKRIKDPASALKVISQFRNVVFVDDFIGSGQQMLHTWHGKHEIAPGQITSFDGVSTLGSHRFYYCATVCSAVGHANLGQLLPDLRLFAANVLREEDSLIYPGRPIWRGRYDESMALLKHYSEKAGYQAENGGENDWRGFHRQGLGLAYWHGVPDATLPVFRSTRNNWKPLVRTKG
ncbi:hypothetical protein Rleg4DRAFT_2464 [Rhizobium leguminosarum bv. trifolii WSM2297]|uniref:PRTase-CE domain-containing protein n=1 Tax=Rhizobium leguminosarum bv. trifolii WSM2297 TaxID=754762 RepID=J0W6M3_RHILT|nr:hypothetical protein [Rhizobium leguminosarum]EJC80803.1 hypothetical protein Rleg4DRAFT_2464 [Rhizobium leguminosarum bv. trifolii WSM2297]